MDQGGGACVAARLEGRDDSARRRAADPGARTRASRRVSICGLFDNYGLDSFYDYDPLWRKFIELKIAVTSTAAWAYVICRWGAARRPLHVQPLSAATPISRASYAARS